MIQGIHHFAIIVSSENTVKFYERLGFEIFKRVERQQDVVLLLYGHGIQLEIFVDSTHPTRHVPEPLGLRHLALKVDDIAKTSSELELDVGPVMEDWVKKRFCFTSDPDRNTIELHE